MVVLPNAFKHLRRFRYFHFFACQIKLSPLKNKNASQTSFEKHCARDWMIPHMRDHPDTPTRGITKTSSCFAGLGFSFSPLIKASFERFLNKKPPRFHRGGFSARDWIRTSTWFPTLRPEHSASTNFATRAFKRTCF
jgi:hypothetical protein